jgi:hypothetical protein
MLAEIFVYSIFVYSRFVVIDDLLFLLVCKSSEIFGSYFMGKITLLDLFSVRLLLRHIF